MQPNDMQIGRIELKKPTPMVTLEHLTNTEQIRKNRRAFEENRKAIEELRQLYQLSGDDSAKGEAALDREHWIASARQRAIRDAIEIVERWWHAAETGDALLAEIRDRMIEELHQALESGS